MQENSVNNICSIICSYHPNVDKLKDLTLVLSKLSTVIIVDNAQELDRTSFEGTDNLIILKPDENLGTLKAYNFVFNKYPNFNYYWLWDQDTIISLIDSSKFLSLSLNLFGQDRKLIASTFYDKRNWINPINRNMILIKGSTTIINMDRLRNLSIESFDEHLFMDYGDWDLSFRIQNAGGKIIQLSGINYEHFLGDSEQTRIGSFSRSSESRLYMQGLNFAYLIRKYGLYNFIGFLLLLRFFILPVKNLLFKNSYLRTKIYFKGIMHGFRGVTSSDYISKLNA